VQDCKVAASELIRPGLLLGPNGSGNASRMGVAANSERVAGGRWSAAAALGNAVRRERRGAWVVTGRCIRPRAI